MREINPNIYPASGYRFTDRDGTRHKGGSWAMVKRKVKQYRERVGLPTDTIWEEMMNQVCAETPGMCGETAPQPVAAAKPAPSLSLNQRVLQWYSKLLAKKRVNTWQTVASTEAARRAAICGGCPAQRPLNSACGACIRSVSASHKALLNGRESKFQNLHPCGILGEDCQVSVYAIQPPDPRPDLPAHCWRRP